MFMGLPARYVSRLQFTRWRLVIILWCILVYLYVFQRTQHVLVTDPSSILELAHCHVNSMVINQPDIKSSRKTLCCPNATQLNVHYANIHLSPTFYHVFRATPDVCFGAWRPNHCRPHQNVVILIPYRDRELHLRLLLARLHPLLQHQGIHYRIYVIEQYGNAPFNRGLLLNIGIREALLRDPAVDCFVFHDIDMLPENSDNLYVCDENLRHMASGVNEFRYHVPFVNYAGGVSSLSKDNVIKTNGFPNRYWGWGNEDDELAARCYLHGLQLSRPRTFVGRYRAVRHLKATRGSGHYDSFRAFRSFLNDGLTALNDTAYRILVDTSPERMLHHSLWASESCEYSHLMSGLNLSVTDWIGKARLETRVPEKWMEQWDAVARLLLYTHILVDTEPMHKRTVSPTTNTRESWYWFLHFYGWI